MWSKARKLFVILSVSLNVAFLSVWLGNELPTWFDRPGASKEAEPNDPIWCPLHRELGVNEEQWRQIEPHLAEFKTIAQERCQKMSALRMEMMDLLASPHVEIEAAQVKQEEILAAQRRMQTLVIEHLLTEKKVLTPQQQNKLFDMIRAQSKCSGRGPFIWPGPGKGIGQVLRDGNGNKGKRP
jgi:Spy/CpxP family protein refolding chaperone